MPIRVLSEDVASQIAAGEVVERPASVVKELIENAIDAGAAAIQVRARSGGKEFVSVVDDGCGVPRGEVELAFHRHATSKLTTADDLQRIATLGFRGEALASIASVSRMTFTTRASGEAVGSLLRLEGGEIQTRREVGRPPGTAVTVENLFFNIPARRKFLRTDRTERRHIDQWVTRYAIAYPDIRFTLDHSGQNALQSPGSGELRDVVAAVYGPELGEQALSIVSDLPGAAPAIRVLGLVGPPSFHRANRTYITIFVNGRWVQDPSLTYAITQAYHRFLPTGRHPLAIVLVDLPPGDVDVNVHPAKAEVRFRDGDAVFRAVQKAVRRTLLERGRIPAAHRPVGSSDGSPGWPPSSLDDGDIAGRRERLIRLGGREVPTDGQLRLATDAWGDRSGSSIPPLRVIGQLRTTYIVAEGPDGMVLLDQHAAHERVLFEQLLAQREEDESASQSFLDPVLVELSPETADLVEEQSAVLARLGFDLEPFGGSTVLVRALPTIIAEDEPDQVLEDAAVALRTGNEPLGIPLEELVARQVCKRAAIKAGHTLDHPEMEALIRALEQCQSPRTCPHGRPTMIRLTVSQLAREFGRS